MEDKFARKVFLFLNELQLTMTVETAHKTSTNPEVLKITAVQIRLGTAQGH